MAVDDFFCWLNTNSGILTLLTAIATFITCWCSFISAKATRAQVEEMRRQYKEENRPFIGTELTYVRRTFYGIKFINHGKQPAYHVKIQFDRSFIDSLPEKVYQTLLLEQEGRECIIGINQNYTIFVGTNKMRNYSTLQSASRLGRPAKANGHCPNSLGAFLYNPLPLPILFCSGDFRGYQAVRRGS